MEKLSFSRLSPTNYGRETKKQTSNLMTIYIYICIYIKVSSLKSEDGILWLYFLIIFYPVIKLICFFDALEVFIFKVSHFLFEMLN